MKDRSMELIAAVGTVLADGALVPPMTVYKGKAQPVQ